MSPAPGTLIFQCNVCGATCQWKLDELQRETASCSTCHSSPRVRAIVDVFARQVIGQSIPLPDFPDHGSLRGLGLTDSESYASRLAQKFNYQNTYFHQAPRLDIARDLEPSQLGSCDFVISSEIFEHVMPPVARAFENVFRLLKPGGLFVLTVPYGQQSQTIEHFPELNDFTIDKAEGRYVLTNRTREGLIQKFDRLVFHGGEGSTLEMRVFAECDLLRHLAAAGFSEVKIHQESSFKYGIWWPQPWSRPISARKPKILS
jgi:SAM-dependent methyltransferase